MAICNNCKAQIPDNSTACPNCGAPQNNTGYGNPIPANMQGADYSAQFDPNDVQSNKVMAVLAYIGLLFLVPLLAAPQSRYARFHTNQGLVLFIFDIAGGIVIGVLSAILIFVPVAGPIIASIISAVIGIGIFVLMILGIVNAATGKAKELPIIGKIKILK